MGYKQNNISELLYHLLDLFYTASIVKCKNESGISSAILEF